MTDQRFVDIETKLAHQEHLLLELNDVITKQQEKIMPEAAPTDPNVDEVPPHY
jgi:uncharacterized coiled-coil protein SlyX